MQTKTVSAVGCFLMAVAAWLVGPRALGGVAQAPTSGLPALDYSLGEDSQPQSGVPHGTLSRHVLAPGKFFPGTRHNYQIYVPAQYDPGRPIAHMIFTMGIQVCEQPGRGTNILNKPEFNATPATGIAFGGPGRAWLYVTQGGKVFRREAKRTGVVAWEPVKPPQPGL